MAKTVKPLTDSQIKKATIQGKEYKLFDGGGLFLLIKTNGKKFWRRRYKIDGKEKQKSLGEYPFVSLANAREQSNSMKEMLSRGENPSRNKKRDDENKNITFEKVVEKFLEFKIQELSENYWKKVKRRYEVYTFAAIGKKEIGSIDKSEIISLIKNIPNVKTTSTKHTNKSETQRIVLNLLEQVFRWAVYNDFLENDVMLKVDKKSLIVKKTVEHYRAIVDADELKILYRMIQEYRGSLSVRNALLFLMLSGLRSINVRFLRWEQIDFKKSVVNYAESDMKTGRAFRLPLTLRMIELLKELESITGSHRYVFCSMNSSSKPLSENTLGYALKRMDVFNHTPHGFRSSFSTLAYEHQKEHSFSGEVIESQLAHEVGGRVKMAYLRSDFLEDRRALLEWWDVLLNN